MRILATFCLSFAVTVAAIQYLPTEKLVLPLIIVALSFSFCGLCLKGNRWLRVILIAAGITAALIHASFYDHFVVTPAETFAGTQQTLTLELSDYPQQTAYGARCEVRVLHPDFTGRALYYGENELLCHEPGEQLTACVLAKRASDPYDENDRLTTFTSRGIHLLLYNDGAETYDRAEAGALRYLPQRSANLLGEQIDSLFSPRVAAFFRALLLGDRTKLTQADASRLSEAGIYHITAVSGLHCGFLLAVAVFLIGRWYAKLLCAVTIPLLIFYTVLTGASPSAIRASIMLSLVVLALVFGREPDGPTSLSFSLFLILLVNPYAITSVSLQLSYAAVGGILWLTPKLIKRIGKRGKVLRVVLTSFAVTLGASVFSVPFSAYYFGRISLVMFLGNLLCLWAVSVVFTTGFVVLLVAMLLPPVGMLLAPIVSVGALYVLETAELLAKLPYHALYFNHPVNVLWLVYVYALFGLCVLVLRLRYRYWIASVLAVMTLVSAVFLTRWSFQDGRLHVIALDVGQGQSILVMHDDYAALIDCGSSTSYIDTGDLTADYLLTAGHHNLDALILTHDDSDHSNGLETLDARIAIERIFLSSEEEKSDAEQLAESLKEKVNRVCRKEEAGSEALSLSLYPSQYGGKEDNETGIAVKADFKDFSLLITGDMSAAAEEQLVEDYNISDVDVLVVGHHGSKNATSRKALEVLSPEVGIISVGRNSYGHPAEETLYRLSDRGMTVYRTDLQGNIHIKVN